MKILTNVSELVVLSTLAFTKYFTPKNRQLELKVSKAIYTKLKIQQTVKINSFLFF